MAKKLSWKTVRRKVNDLIPFDKNPRKITPEKEERLRELVNKFNLVEIPVINFDNTLICGNQRCKALQILGRGEELIDVRIPNRQLTPDEVKEYSLIGNTHVGDWDYDVLEAEFADFKLEDYDISIPEIEYETARAIPKPAEKPVDDAKRWFVYIDCVTEKEAQKMYTELTGRGFETKVVN